MSLHLAASLAARDVAVELTVADGETLALLGPNGAGKSTVLGMLAGLVRPDEGRATLGDHTLFDLPGAWRPPHQRGVALLAQDALLFPHLSVRDNVAFGPRSSGAGRADARERADEWMRRTATAEFADRRPAELSGGQAQRVAVARALAAEPRLLLLDEPLSALDVAVAAELRGTLAGVLAGRTTVLVTHDALDAYLLADRVAVMHEGRVVEQGPMRQVLERPRNPFTAELSGLTLVAGARTADGLVTGDGMRLRGTAVERVEVGARALAAVRPSAVRVLPDGDGSDRPERIHATVTGLEPQADLVRVRTDRLDALVPPADVADLRLRVGDRVTLDVPPAAATVYPA
ncbi:molybdate transport system ATP-binding protein [Leifsonia sp. 98AMF]|uniref:sulfate/molybdate ABC transporter ATP-binding protein n=1 Tax=unclassified Leifsonia TaxID=2663824 RepID=UPI00087C45A5|nr:MULTISPECIES: ABC transporter ATP-binding protein [unclassified Leifsonia]SDH25838.1 molybdate transport system ATP-binding protein [Leifsonia sp. 197AMF]SDJ12576.1 molybdate transport system ATP-binding protein [Leifsonia sp. 466MF]SDJ56645.1 molybdate transport system ATP-binding protein [Leifsonia sp. 157MF]SDN34086.1 molybdate transport system ATP-binding protein [Leifsonia sp. 509MF]SEM87619.1 molybdate transport system ATP-binding protein [Leifsonia sp. 467MF]